MSLSDPPVVFRPSVKPVLFRPVVRPVVFKISGGRGPAGTSGADGFEFTQASPATEWIVNHNLGHYPSVTVRSPGGVEIEALVTNFSVNQVRINFSVAQAGTAYCI